LQFDNARRKDSEVSSLVKAAGAPPPSPVRPIARSEGSVQPSKLSPRRGAPRRPSPSQTRMVVASNPNGKYRSLARTTTQRLCRQGWHGKGGCGSSQPGSQRRSVRMKSSALAQGLPPSVSAQISGTRDLPEQVGEKPGPRGERGFALVGTLGLGWSRVPSFARTVRAGRGRRVAFAWRKEAR
jgi:hypothetical protein